MILTWDSSKLSRVDTLIVISIDSTLILILQTSKFLESSPSKLQIDIDVEINIAVNPIHTNRRCYGSSTSYDLRSQRVEDDRLAIDSPE